MVWVKGLGEQGVNADVLIGRHQVGLDTIEGPPIMTGYCRVGPRKGLMKEMQAKKRTRKLGQH